MAYCGPLGIPHSHFLGGPNRWTPLDQAKALWWKTFEAQRCPSCGTRDEEWDPERGGSIRAYIPVEHQCLGCVVRSGPEKDVQKDDAPGLTIRLVRNPEAPRG